METENTASPPARPSRLRFIITRLLTMTLSLVITFLFLELFMRMGFDVLPANVQGELQSVRRWPWNEEPFVRPVPLINSRTYQTHIDPGLRDFAVRWHDARFTFNTRAIWDGHPLGLRNEDEPQWPLDIVAFGDSFTFCWTAYEDCWVQKLVQDYGWRVTNAGLSGTGSGGQLTLMQELAEPLQPRVIIWQWYPNDITDEFVLSWLREETEWLEWPHAAPPIPPAEGLAQYSALYRLLDRYVLNPDDDPEYEYNQIVTVNDHDLSVVSGEFPHPFSFNYTSATYGWEHHINYRMEGVAYLQTLCQRDDNSLCIEMVMVFVPTKEEAYAEFLEDGALDADYLASIGESRRRMLALCEAEGWRCLDATPVFQEAIRQDRATVYYATDFHLDASGNQLLADVVADYLIENGLLPGPE